MEEAGGSSIMSNKLTGDVVGPSGKSRLKGNPFPFTFMRSSEGVTMSWRFFLKHEFFLTVLLTAVFLFAPSLGSFAFAQSASSKEKPQWVLDHEKAHAGSHPTKPTKPTRKIGGTAVKGAKKVSPLVLNKNK